MKAGKASAGRKRFVRAPLQAGEGEFNKYGELPQHLYVIGVERALRSKNNRTRVHPMSDMMSKALMLIGATGDRPFHLIYGQEAGNHQPFIIITVTPEYVAHKISKMLPLAPGEFANFINDNAGYLREVAMNCRNQGKTGAVLTAKLPDAPHNLICTIEHLREQQRPPRQENGRHPLALPAPESAGLNLPSEDLPQELTNQVWADRGDMTVGA